MSYFRETANRYQDLFQPIPIDNLNAPNSTRDSYNGEPLFEEDQDHFLMVNIAEYQQVKIEVYDENSLLAAISYQVAMRRDYKLVLDYFDKLETLFPLLHLLGLLIVDIDYLGTNGVLRDLLIRLTKRVESLRAERYKMEDNLIKNTYTLTVAQKFSDLIQTEKNLLLCYAILTYYDNLTDYTDESLLQLFLGADYAEPLTKYPYNFKLYFEEETNMMRLSMVIAARYPTFHKDNTLSIKKKLKDSVRTLKIKLEDACEKGKILVGKINSPNSTFTLDEPDKILIDNSLNMLLEELGEFDQQRNHQIIRFLQKYTIQNSRQHNDLFGPIGVTIKMLQEALINSGQIYYRLSAGEVAEVRKVIYIASMLQNFADITRQFFNFHVGSLEQHRYYLNSREQEGFAKDVDDFEKLLNRICFGKKQVDIKDIENLEMLQKRVFDTQMIKPKSTLCKALMTYVVSPLEVMKTVLKTEISALKDAKEKEPIYRRELLRAIYSKTSKQIRQLRKDSEGIPYALCDEPLLREVIRNIISNFHHSNLIPDKSTITYTLIRDHDCQIIDVEEFGKHQSIMFEVKGATKLPSQDTYENRRFTIGNQTLMLRSLGGSIILDRTGDDAYTIELRLISRTRSRLLEPSTHPNR